MLREPVKVSGMRFHQHRLPIGGDTLGPLIRLWGPCGTPSLSMGAVSPRVLAFPPTPALTFRDSPSLWKERTMTRRAGPSLQAVPLLQYEPLFLGIDVGK